MWPNPQKTRIWSHLLNKSLMENFIFCAVVVVEKVNLELALTIFSAVLAIRKNDWHFWTRKNIGMFIVQQTDLKFTSILLFGVLIIAKTLLSLMSL